MFALSAPVNQHSAKIGTMLVFSVMRSENAEVPVILSEFKAPEPVNGRLCWVDIREGTTRFNLRYCNSYSQAIVTPYSKVLVFGHDLTFQISCNLKTLWKL